jgi:hypothetical protein
VALCDGWTTLVKDVETNRTLFRLTLPAAAVPMSFSPDGGLLALAAEDGTHLVETATGRERAWLKPGAGLCHFLKDGEHLACCDGEAVVLRQVDDVLAAAEKAPPPDPTDPPGVPLEAELVARQDTYTLDLEGDTPEDFSTRVWFGRAFPDPPQVGLVLKLRNTGKAKITLHNPQDTPTLHLDGAGALSHPWDTRQTVVGPGAAPVTLEPGESHTIPITELSRDGFAFWLLPGEYRIMGRYLADVSPAPKGSSQGMGDSGFVEVRFAPVKVTVLPAKGAPAVRPADESDDIRRPPPPGTVIVPQPDDGSAGTRDKLAMPIKFNGVDAGTPLEEVLDRLKDRYDLDLRIDQAAFDKTGNRRIGREPVEIPPLANIRLNTLLQVLLDQVEADLDVRGRTAWVVPPAKPGSLADRLRPARRHFRESLGQPVTLAGGIAAGTSLAEALRRVADRCDLNIIVDVRAFQRARMRHVRERPVELAPQKDARVSTVLAGLLDQAGATFVPREDIVLVIPKDGG